MRFRTPHLNGCCGLLAILLALALAAVPFPASATDEPASPGNVSEEHDAGPLISEGMYRVEGRNAEGVAYTGRCIISYLGEGAYHFSWHMSNSESYAGTGRLRDNVISVKWSPDPNVAPLIFTVNGQSELHGTWAGGAASESLIPLN